MFRIDTKIQRINQKNTVNKRIVSSTLANIIRQPIIRVLTVIGSIVVARVLGPDGLAVLAAIRANTNTILSFMDFGISRSIPKILPDMSIEYGRKQALEFIKQLLKIKLFFVLLGFIGLIILENTGILNLRQSFVYSHWFYPIVGINLFLNTIIIFKQREWIASLRMSALAKLQIAIAFLSPILIVITTVLWHDPYKVAVCQLLLLFLEFIILIVLPGYDLDEEKKTFETIKLYIFFQRFWKYLSTAYLIFIFNSFVFGLPLTFYILSAHNVGSFTIGLISVTIAIIKLGEEIANVPLTNLRVPIMARMVAEGDNDRFLKMQRIMTSIIVLTSGIIAIAMFTMASPILSKMYGEQYSEAIRWGVPFSVTALFFNIFSMGNSTIRQVQKFSPVIIGLCFSIIFIVCCNISIVSYLDEKSWPPFIVLTYVIGKGLFLVITDLWTDFTVFKWRGSIIKIRGIMSLGIAIILANLMIGIVNTQSLFININIFIVTLLIFILIFKIFGGLGKEVLSSINNVVSDKTKWFLKYL